MLMNKKQSDKLEERLGLTTEWKTASFEHKNKLTRTSLYFNAANYRDHYETVLEYHSPSDTNQLPGM